MRNARGIKRPNWTWAALALSIIFGFSGLNACYAGQADDLLKQAEQIKNHNDDFRVELRTRGDKEGFKIGDEISFTVRTSKDCYLTLINIGPSGKPVIIFPNKWFTSNFVKAGRDYIIPPPDSKYRMIADEPKGVEMIKAIASLQPIKALENADVTQAGNFRVIEKPGLVMKGIRMEVGEKKKDEWSTSELVFSIDSASKRSLRGATNLCKGDFSGASLF